jgi:hypothetical protein
VHRTLLGLLCVLLLAGCGDEEKDVREAVVRFAQAARSEDARTACDSVTPRTRQLLGRLSRARLGRRGCEALLEQRFDQSSGREYAIDAGTLAAVEEADVEIHGDRARVRTADLPLERSDGEWRLDLAGLTAHGYSMQASVLCTENEAAGFDAALPAPTREGYAAEAREAAGRADALAARLETLDPPRNRLATHRELVGALRGQAHEVRRVAQAIGAGERVLDAVTRRAAPVRRLQGNALEAQRRLQVACDASALRPGAARYRERAERVCRAVSRRIDRLGEPGPDLGTYMRRVRRAGARVSRALADARPPRGLERLHLRTVQAYDQALAAIPAIARAPDPDAAYDRYGLLFLRAATGFGRLGLPTCASL